MAKICYITQSQMEFLKKYGSYAVDDVVSFEKIHKRIIKEINDYEERSKYMAENGGVAASPYTPIIKHIVNFVSAFVKKEPQNIENGWRILIPCNLTKSIDFAKKITLIVTVHENKSGKYNSGEGKTEIHPEPSSYIDINEKKFEDCTITINSYSYNRKLFTHTLTISLIHELNHKYEELQVYLKNINSDDSYRISNDNTMFYNVASQMSFSYDKATDTFIKDILYRLFNDSELNAFARQIYGELLGNKYTSFSEYKRNSICFSYYEELKKRLINLKKEDVNWANLLGFFSVAKNYNVQTDINVFANRFIKETAKRLKKLYKKMLQSAATYFSMLNEYDEIIKPMQVIEHINKEISKIHENNK